ncbi:T-box transcription factor TBX3-like [Musca vetustissima]|uniref:T-box transcription factor TBX3-like n=1 Tax=Musca vetustissima TaxID=27455 RepID=UPI002AB76C19|nr:T-box transcription factor TBX3-like [Musca vetustissima]
MFNVHDLMEYRMQQQLAQEIYRQQIMQRIPDPFPPMLPMHVPMPHHLMAAPPRPKLPGNVEAKLENNDLWQQFHKIGTEMIITKSGRRMFPSMRVSVTGLEEDTQYCVLLEMVPIGDCRYKFSGSQWVPAGGAEPQSPQRMFLHPDSPANGSHWQSQAILFNKVKLTNNTLDNSGQIVLASMHKYQPRLHIIKTSDLTQLPWSPQQNFVFPETEFIAVTAYQNDRITKLKIDNNPFAKGFRETGQSKCKRKLMSSSSSTSPSSSNSTQGEESDDCQSKTEDDRSSVGSYESPQQKRLRPSENSDEESGYSSSRSSRSISPRFEEYATQQHHLHHHQQQQHYGHQLSAYSTSPTSSFYHPQQHLMATASLMQHPLQTLLRDSPPTQQTTISSPATSSPSTDNTETSSNTSSPTTSPTPPANQSNSNSQKRNNFSISAILAF